MGGSGAYGGCACAGQARVQVACMGNAVPCHDDGLEAGTGGGSQRGPWGPGGGGRRGARGGRGHRCTCCHGLARQLRPSLSPMAYRADLSPEGTSQWQRCASFDADGLVHCMQYHV